MTEPQKRGPGRPRNEASTPKDDDQTQAQADVQKAEDAIPETELEAELSAFGDAIGVLTAMIEARQAPANKARYSQRWLAIARTQIELGGLALMNAVILGGE